MLVNRIRSAARLFGQLDPNLSSAKSAIKYFRQSVGKRYSSNQESVMIKNILSELAAATQSYLGESLFQQQTGIVRWLENRSARIVH